MRKNNKNNLKYMVFLIILLVSAITTLYEKFSPDSSSPDYKKGEISVSYIDVGQGDSTLIITPSKKTVLIDAGDESHSDKVVNFLKSKGIKKIDILIGTHPDADHIGGIDKVIDNFDICAYYTPDVKVDTLQYKQVKASLKKKNLKSSPLYMKDIIDFEDGAVLKILSPVKGVKYSDNNQASIVARLVYKNTSFLFMGDADMENEITIINNFANIKSDVLKLGHHGSSTSSSDYFITKVSPKIAVISCGDKNKYGHPHKETMNVMKKHNISIYRTDKQNDITLTSDGESISSNKKPTDDYSSGKLKQKKKTVNKKSVKKAA